MRHVLEASAISSSMMSQVRGGVRVGCGSSVGVGTGRDVGGGSLQPKRSVVARRDRRVSVVQYLSMIGPYWAWMMWS